MTDRQEDEVKLSEEEIDRLLIETLEDPSPEYMNTNEQEKVDELVKLSEEEIDLMLIETLDDSSPVYMNTNEQENVIETVRLSELEEFERMKKEKEEQEEIERIKKQREEREEIDLMLIETPNDLYLGYMNTKEKEDVNELVKLLELEEIERIKKKKEEREEIDLMQNDSHSGYLSKVEEEEIDRVLNEMAKVKPLEYMSKKEEEDLDEYMNSMMMIKEEQPESSTKTRYEIQPNVSKRKRSVATAEADRKAPELDPLQIAMEMVSRYRDFVSYLLAVLRQGRGNAEMEIEKWKKVIDRGILLVMSMNPRLERLPREMERMEKDENLQKEYAFRKAHLGGIMKQLRDVNAGIEGSPDFSLVSDVRYAEKVLPNCLILLRRSKEELSELIQVIEALKVIDKEEDDAEYEEEMEIM